MLNSQWQAEIQALIDNAGLHKDNAVRNAEYDEAACLRDKMEKARDGFNAIMDLSKLDKLVPSTSDAEHAQVEKSSIQLPAFEVPKEVQDFLKAVMENGQRHWAKAVQGTDLVTAPAVGKLVDELEAGMKALSKLCPLPLLPEEKPE